ncbi:hypothetical protein B0H14DRAFT_2762593 [Mycena olivaceomarginata]|nr:hypothetical protein B0H14DRAFT_2762593 [Mycena olivaceomarginata]
MAQIFTLTFILSAYLCLSLIFPPSTIDSASPVRTNPTKLFRFPPNLSSLGASASCPISHSIPFITPDVLQADLIDPTTSIDFVAFQRTNPRVKDPFLLRSFPTLHCM